MDNDPNQPNRRKFIKTIGGVPITMALCALVFQTPVQAHSAGCAKNAGTTPAVQDTDCNANPGFTNSDNDCSPAMGSLSASNDAHCVENVNLAGDNSGDGDCSPVGSSTPASEDNSCALTQLSCTGFSDVSTTFKDSDCTPPTVSGSTLSGGSKDSDCGTPNNVTLLSSTTHQDSDCTTLPPAVNAGNHPIGQDQDCGKSKGFLSGMQQDNDCWAPAGTPGGTYGNDADDQDND